MLRAVLSWSSLPGTRVTLRRSYARLAKGSAIMVGRYTHAHQLQRANCSPCFLSTRLGLVTRGLSARSRTPALEPRFAPCAHLPIGSASRTIASADPRSTRCTLPR